MEVKISAVIITFNEEKNIERCLTSLIDIADEIVVVDSFSSDKTRDICVSQGVKFVTHKFEGHIQQKNWAINQASNKIVLSLDADEAISAELKESILTVKKNWEQDGYSFNRMTNYCGKWIKHGLWYPDVKLRLWDSSKGSWGGKNPHDTYLLKDSTTQKHLKGDLLHYSYYSIEEHKLQADKFAKIASKAYFEAGKKSSIIKIIFSPISRFISSYIMNRGFLDGKAGWTIAHISYKETKLKYKLLKELQSS
ncbi:glycosyltransferase family 2 protein [Flavobacteriales bacterium]|nr:glycosyltransferase family 2 protein [Flavobacteriales bacterium]